MDVNYSVLRTSASPLDSFNSRDAYGVLEKTEWGNKLEWYKVSNGRLVVLCSASTYPSISWESKLRTSSRIESGNVLSNSVKSTVMVVKPKLATYTMLAAPESELE